MLDSKTMAENFDPIVNVTIYDPSSFFKYSMPEDNGKQKPNESYKNKYLKHVYG